MFFKLRDRAVAPWSRQNWDRFDERPQALKIFFSNMYYKFESFYRTVGIFTIFIYTHNFDWRMVSKKMCLERRKYKCVKSVFMSTFTSIARTLKWSFKLVIRRSRIVFQCSCSVSGSIDTAVSIQKIIDSSRNPSRGNYCNLILYSYDGTSYDI